MLSLTKKSDAQPVAAPLWHTNFRNFERLPDTKVVRTTFFVNTAAIALTLGLMLWLGFREYRIHNLGEQIDQAQAQIDSNAKQNKEALRLTKVFLDEEKKIADALTFTQSPLVLSDFLDTLGHALPKEIAIDYIETRMGDAKNQVVVLRGIVAGTRDQAAGSASSFVDSLRAHPRLGAVFDPVTLEKLTPDGTTGFMAFEITMKVKTEGKK